MANTTYATMTPTQAATLTGNVRPGATWGNRYHWTRNADGTVTVRNYRTRCALTFPNVGAALTLAKLTRRDAITANLLAPLYAAPLNR